MRSCFDFIIRRNMDIILFKWALNRKRMQLKLQMEYSSCRLRLNLQKTLYTYKMHLKFNNDMHLKVLQLHAGTAISSTYNTHLNRFAPLLSFLSNLNYSSSVKEFSALLKKMKSWLFPFSRSPRYTCCSLLGN